MSRKSLYDKEFGEIISEQTKRAFQKLIGFSLVAILVAEGTPAQNGETIRLGFTNVTVQPELLHGLLFLAITYYLINSLWRVWNDQLIDATRAVLSYRGNEKESWLNLEGRAKSAIDAWEIYLERIDDRPEPKEATTKAVAELAEFSSQAKFFQRNGSAIALRALLLDVVIPITLASFALIEITNGPILDQGKTVTEARQEAVVPCAKEQ